jgi:hypothetical protein
VTSSVSGKRSPAELTAPLPRRDATRAAGAPRDANAGANPRTSDGTKSSPKHATKARDPSTPVNSPDPGQI